MSILDLVLIGIVAISALIGLSKGFFKSLFSFFGWLISILMAFSLAELIANRLMGETVINILIGSDSIYEFIYGILPESIKNIKIETVKELFNEGNQAAVQAYVSSQSEGIAKLFSSLISAAAIDEVYLGSSLNNLGQAVSVHLTYQIYVVAVGVIFFALFRIVVFALSLVVKVSGADKNILSKLGGMALGAVKGAVYAVLVLIVLGYIGSSGLGIATSVREHIDNSMFNEPVMNFVNAKLEEVEQKAAQQKTAENKGYIILFNALEARISEQTNSSMLN